MRPKFKGGAQNSGLASSLSGMPWMWVDLALSWSSKQICCRDVQSGGLQAYICWQLFCCSVMDGPDAPLHHIFKMKDMKCKDADGIMLSSMQSARVHHHAALPEVQSGYRISAFFPGVNWPTLPKTFHCVFLSY
eukprot:1157824-Pelagomonas_calceolata.AAC.5